jgi:Ca2+-binding RTX toxin-like protein
MATINGTTGNDTLNGSDDAGDSIMAGSGNDLVQAYVGADTVFGGAGADTLDGGAESDTIYGNTGADSILGGDGDDLLRGDHITGVSLADHASLPSGDPVDWTVANMSAVPVDLYWIDTSGVLVFYATLPADSTFTQPTWVGHHWVIFESGTSNVLEIVMDAGGTTTTIDRSFNDTIRGGDGADSIYGDLGNDSIMGDAGADFLFGGAGDDRVVGGAGHDYAELGDGNDNFGSHSSEDGDDIVFGGAGNDTILVGAGDDIAYGGAGNDNLADAGGSDSLYGGAGDDKISISDDDGGDTIFGGSGWDILTLTQWSNTNGVTVTFTGDDAGSYGFAPGDATGEFSEIEAVATTDHADSVNASADTNGVAIFANGGDDSVIGGSGADTLYGHAGDDRLFGGAGNDKVFGGSGNDTLFGGDGNDSLLGGAGNDRISGGTGADLFEFDRAGGDDLITDFDMTLKNGVTADQLDISDLRDLDCNPVHARDVVVGDDGAGNAVLTFPEGETVTLQGVSPAQITTAQQMKAAGIPCFTAGTLILTPGGEVPVEALRPGDLVVTRDNGPMPILWAGQRRLDATDLAAAPQMRPVRIAPGGLAGPRGLLVSPQHAVLVHSTGRGGTETFARATHLARMRGGKVRVAQGCRSVTYVHLMFAAHQIVFSNGLASESYYPGKWGLAALGAVERREVMALFPSLCAADPTTVYGMTARPFCALPHSLADIRLESYGKAGTRRDCHIA